MTLVAPHKPASPRPPRKTPFRRPAKRRNLRGGGLLVLRDIDEKRTQGRRNPEFPQLNIRETAALMGCTESHLSRLLRRKTHPSLRMAKQLAQAFKISIEEVEEIYNGRKEGFTIVPHSGK